MSALLSFVIVLFVMKVAWNLTIPWTSLRRRREGSPKSGVSIMLELEVGLLLIAWLLSFLTPPLLPWLDTWQLLLFGIGAIVASYLLMMVIGAILVRFVREPGHDAR
jgi:hypothetical protein